MSASTSTSSTIAQAPRGAARRAPQVLHGLRDPPHDDALRATHEQVLRELQGRRPRLAPRRRRGDLRRPGPALVAPGKEHPDIWFHVHDTAHRLGIPTHCTILYGHVETYEERIDHLLRLRDQQDRTGGFLAFIPLAFHPENTVFERRGFRFQRGERDRRSLRSTRPSPMRPSARSTLGAIQNRLEDAVDNLGVYEENISAAQSRIRDVDVAAETVNFTKLQILSQSGTAMLAQANSAPRTCSRSCSRLVPSGVERPPHDTRGLGSTPGPLSCPGPTTLRFTRGSRLGARLAHAACAAARCDRAGSYPAAGGFPAPARAVRRLRHRLRGDARPLRRGATTAIRHAEDVVSAERSLGIFREQAVQHWAMDAAGVVLEIANWTYLQCQFTITFGFLLWVYLRRNDAWPFLRNTVIIGFSIGIVGYLSIRARLPPLAEGPRIRVRRHAADRQRERAGWPGVRAREPVRGDAEPAHGDRAARRHVGRAAVPEHARPRDLGALPGLVVFAIVATANHFILDAIGGAGVFLVATSASLSVSWYLRGRPLAPVPPAHRDAPSLRDAPEAELSITRLR